MAVISAILVLATTCSMHPGQRLGPQRGGRQQQGAAVPTPGEEKETAIRGY